ncbi:MAG: hypothetical protein MJZ09_09125 [Bacteroidales bacterium]|nr:hypothetical protein [Bacteroidales bacterium]
MKTLKHILTIVAVMFAGCPRTAVSCPTSIDLKSLITPRASREGRDLVPNIDYTEYDEGIYVGYRYFTTSKTDVAYPFGYGLSYTFFKYEIASVEASADGFVARVSVRNTGSRPGREGNLSFLFRQVGGRIADRLLVVREKCVSLLKKDEP